MRVSSLLSCVVGIGAFLLPALAAPGAFEGGTAELTGSSWEGEASLQLVLRSRAGNGRERLPSADVAIAFPTSTTVTVNSAAIGNLTGTWEPRKGSRRRLVGVPDPGTVAAEAEALRGILEGIIQDRVGPGATVEIEPRDGKLKARLDREGTRLDAKLRYRFRGRIRVRGRSVPFQLIEKGKVRATQRSK